ncbi:hypothetical protein M2273_002144 [Mucilaginibacter lappiensis]
MKMTGFFVILSSSEISKKRVITRRPHSTLYKGEGFKMLFKISPKGGDLEGASRNDAFVNRYVVEKYSVST